MNDEEEYAEPEEVDPIRECALMQSIDSFSRNGVSADTGDFIERAKAFEKYLRGDDVVV